MSDAANDNVIPMKPTMERFLTMAEIMAAEDTTYTTAPAWGGMVRLGSLDAGTMIKFTEDNKKPEKEKTAGIRILIQSLVDEQGNRIGRPEMQEMFMKKNARAISDLVGVIMRLNGFSKEGVDVATHINAAKGDAAKLTALVAELRSLAQLIEDAGTDTAKLEAVITDPVEARRKADQEARKNDSGKMD